MERRKQIGYLVLADISGYTSFVAQTEIEHAEMALSLLLESVVQKLSGALNIIKLEGDAVFACQEEGRVPNGATLLSLIDQTYLTFRDQAEALHRNATCPCKACRAIPTLDLKFIVHHGEFICQNIAGIKDVLGTDVNLAHRLMKNHVAEATGWRGYALFTEPGLAQTQVDRTPFIQQTETYEHLGDVAIYVRDMHMRYNELKSM